MGSSTIRKSAVVFIAAALLVVPGRFAFAQTTASVSVNIFNPSEGEVFPLEGGATTATVSVDGDASVEGPGGGGDKDTTLVYVLDRSTSMSKTAGVDCTGDSTNDNRLVCEQRAVGAANGKAALANSIVALAGLAHFGPDGVEADVDRTTPDNGKQLLKPPEFDSNDTGTAADVVDAANAVAIGNAGTNYSAGLQSTFEILADPANNQPHNLVIFLSDGRNNSGVAVSSLQAQVPANTSIKTFAIGADVNCTTRSEPGELGSLQDVANLSTEGPGAGTTAGVCKVVSDMSKLADEIATAIGSTTTLNSLTWSMVQCLESPCEATPPAQPTTKTPIPNSGIDPDLPQTAPKTVTYTFNAEDLAEGAYEICVQAHGASGSTPLEDEACVHIVVGGGVDPCTAANRDPGLLTEDTLGQTLWDIPLLQIPPLTEDPDRDGILSGPIGTLFEDPTTPEVGLLETVGDEVACLIDLLLDQNSLPDL